VTVIIVRVSNVGVKVGMVGRGVRDANAVTVAVGRDVRVAVVVRDGVAVTDSLTGTVVV
jgi:hypothetical protein